MKEELKRILYAEDEEDIREIVRISLTELSDFDLRICASGQELLDTFDAFRPQLILLDVMMPGMDGVETFNNLKQKEGFDSCPVVFMTAKVQTNEVQSYKDMGAVDVISKPFKPVELAELLRNIWSQIPES